MPHSRIRAWVHVASAQQGVVFRACSAPAAAPDEAVQGRGAFPLHTVAVHAAFFQHTRGAVTATGFTLPVQSMGRWTVGAGAGGKKADSQGGAFHGKAGSVHVYLARALTSSWR